jgi:prepilin-type processing-associated H-X9-DG protein
MALTRVELLLVIGIVLPFLLFAMTGIRLDLGGTKAARIKCVNNLKNLGLAFRTFPGPSSGDAFPGQFLMTEGAEMSSLDAVKIFGRLTNEVKDPRIFLCTSDKTKRAANVITNLTPRNVSYFASLTADETRRDVFWAGDRNIATNGVAVGTGLFALTTNGAALSWTKEIHKEQGNVLMGDGSVQQMSSSRLRSAVREQEVGTNWLVVP